MNIFPTCLIPIMIGVNGLTEITVSANMVELYDFIAEPTYTYHLILEYTKLP